MNGLITDGIPLGIPIQILTEGLGPNPPDPPTPGGSPAGGLLSNGVKTILSPDVSYTAPNTATRLTFQCFGAGLAVVYGSLDNLNWGELFTINGGEVVTIQSNIIFLQYVTDQAIELMVIPRQEKL